MTLSYANGPSTLPLRGETIGRALQGCVEAHGDRDALVSCHQGIRLTYAQLAERVERGRARRCSRAASSTATGSGSGRRTAPSGSSSSTRRRGSARSSSTSTRRTARTSSSTRCASPGCSLLVDAPAFKDADYVAMLRGRRRARPATRGRAARRRVGRAARRGDGVAPSTSSPSARGGAAFDEPINIQYTSGTTGFPKGATLSHHNILNNGFFIGETLGYTPDDRVCVPVPFYHCFGMVLGQPRRRHARRLHRDPVRGVRPARGARGRRRRSAARRSTACRRCSSPSSATRDFGAFDLSSLRTGIMAGSPCPVEVMRRVRSEMHMDEVTICYGMTETSPVSTQTRRDDPLDKRVGTVGAVHPHVEVKIDRSRRPAAIVPRGDAGRAVHARLLGDARLLGRRRRRRARRSTRRAGCTPATSRRWTTTAT